MPPSLTITPKSALFDQPVTIRAAGLPPDQPIGLESAIEFPWTPGVSWKASATYQTDAHGELTLATPAPAAGGDPELDPMRLFWSLRPVTRTAPPAAVADLDTGQPLRMTFTLTGGKQNLAAETIERRMQIPEIQAISYAADGVRGKFFCHSDGLPRPGILFLSGAGSLAPILPISALLASYGYSVLALAYFGGEGMPPALQEIPIERFKEAIHWLSRQPAVLKDRIGVMGGSKGGELALLVSSLVSQVKAVAAIVPSSIIFLGIGSSYNPKKAKSSWSYQGHALPFATASLKALILEVLTQSVRGRSFQFSPAYQAVLQTPGLYQQAVIPVESIHGPILLVSGTDDGYWPSPALCEIAVQRLKENSFSHPVRHLRYEAAGHSFYAPYLLPTAAVENRVLPGVRFSSGGTPEINSRAQVDSWQEILSFFKSSLIEI